MAEAVKEDTHAIEISFGAPVHITHDQQTRLMDLLGDICDDYKARHPDRQMWVMGWGAKLLCHPMAIEDDRPIPFDDSILSVECAERERYEGEK